MGGWIACFTVYTLKRGIYPVFCKSKKFLNSYFLYTRLIQASAIFWILGAGMALCPFTLHASMRIPEGRVLYIRLLTPVSSYSAKEGDRIKAVLIEPIEFEGSPVVPADSIIEGRIRKVGKVGLGFHRETARLDLEFDSLVAPTGEKLGMETRLLAVENAREAVKNGYIQGVHATDTPQGRITSRLRHLPTFNPYTDTAIIAFKAFFPLFPEPEIHLPAGSDFQLKLIRPMEIPDELPPVTGPTEFPETDKAQLDDMVQNLPTRVTDKNGKRLADVTNLLFIGDQEEICRAFAAAGWVGTESHSKRAVAKNFQAFLGKQGYAEAPMNSFLLDDRPADLNFQLSLNNFAMRHHVRIWRLEQTHGAQSLWLASATHDVGATLSIKRLHFYHHVQSRIDLEREKIIRDLAYVGSLRRLHYAPRPAMETSLTNATGEPLTTDGSLAVLSIGPCTRCEPYPSLLQGPEVRYRPANLFARYFRKQILTFRSDVLRSNIIYGVFDLSRLIRNKVHDRPDAGG